MIPYGGMSGLSHESNETGNPCHNDQLLRLKHAEGQIRGVVGMVEQGRYCVDILTQLKAIKSAISAVEANVLERHLNHCVQEAISSKDKKKTAKVIGEIKDLLKKR